MFIGDLRPSGTYIVFRCRLGAAMQYNDQWSIDRQPTGA